MAKASTRREHGRLVSRMAFRSAPPRLLLRRSHRRVLRARSYATIKPVTLVGKAPGPPQTALPLTLDAPSVLDALILSEVRRSRGASLPSLVLNYEDNSGATLETPLPYESRPAQTRRVSFDNSDGVVMVAHAMQSGDAHKVTVCTGFALDVSLPSTSPDGDHETVVVTCAHTLEEVN